MVFFFNDTATTEIYTLSLHDALPILEADGGAVHHDRGRDAVDARAEEQGAAAAGLEVVHRRLDGGRVVRRAVRSEEHTSELQSRQYLVCRLLLEKNTHIQLR